MWLVAAVSRYQAGSKEPEWSGGEPDGRVVKFAEIDGGGRA